MNTTRGGFTLIELLVVISIISLLASIIISSLNTARSKAADATIKSNLVSARTQAEIQYSSLGCYTNDGTTCAGTAAVGAGAGTGVCPAAGSPNIFGQPNIAAQIAAAKLAGGGLASCYATAEGKAWAAAVVLKSDIKKAWCVDSTGASKEINEPFAYDFQIFLDDDLNQAFCET